MMCSFIQMSPEVRESRPFETSLVSPACCVAEWSSGDRTQEIVWSLTANTDIISHTVRLPKPAVFTEIKDQADWGNLYYAMKPVGKSVAWAFS